MTDIAATVTGRHRRPIRPPAGFVADVISVAGRAVRSIPASPRA